MMLNFNFFYLQSIKDIKIIKSNFLKKMLVYTVHVIKPEILPIMIYGIAERMMKIGDYV